MNAKNPSRIVSENTIIRSISAIYDTVPDTPKSKDRTCSQLQA